MSLILTVALSFALCLLLCSRYSPLYILDAPNSRSLHDIPVPRTGGVGIILAVTSAWLLLFWTEGLPAIAVMIGGAALLVASISFVDDLRGLPAWPRLAVHIVAAALLVAGGLIPFEGWLGILLGWFAIVWMVNLYNFMDGMDGFAGGMTLFGFIFLGLGTNHGEAGFYVLLCWSVAAGALGFLWFNLPPARLFMGDTGAATLGLLAASFSLWGVRDGLFAWWFPLLVFSPFIVDASVTIMRRAANGERFWEPHRSHYYQKLVQLGWGHKKTVLAEYALMLLAGVSALVAQQMSLMAFTAAVLVVWCGIYLVIVFLIHRMEKARSR